jgi:hypothetical protein
MNTLDFVKDKKFFHKTTKTKLDNPFESSHNASRYKTSSTVNCPTCIELLVGKIFLTAACCSGGFGNVGGNIDGKP